MRSWARIESSVPPATATATTSAKAATISGANYHPRPAVDAGTQVLGSSSSTGSTAGGSGADGGAAATVTGYTVSDINAHWNAILVVFIPFFWFSICSWRLLLCKGDLFYAQCIFCGNSDIQIAFGDDNVESMLQL